MLQFVVLGHEKSQLSRELLDQRGQFQLLDETIGVFFEFLGLNLLVSVKLIDSLVQLLDLLAALLILSGLIAAQVVQ